MIITRKFMSTKIHIEITYITMLHGDFWHIKRIKSSDHTVPSGFDWSKKSFFEIYIASYFNMS